jgi:organic radical activating enzyme
MYNKNVNSCEGIYNNSLDVRFGKACDNNCAFCIEKSGIESLGDINVKALIESTINSDKKEILILGGEPMLDINKLHEYVMGIRPYKEKIFITTSLPKTVNLENEKVIDILDNINGLNCSIHHYNYMVNNYILKSSSRHDRIKLLKSIVKLYADKVRVQTNLVKDVLDTKEEIEKFLKIMYMLGAQTVKLNELQDAPDQYVNYEKIMGIELPSPYAFGCQTHTEYYMGILSKRMNIILKRSCFLTEKSLEKSGNDLEKLEQHSPNATQVLYENGKIENGWLSSNGNEEEETSCHIQKTKKTTPTTSFNVPNSCHGGSAPSSGCH